MTANFFRLIIGNLFLAPPYYSQRAVFARLWALFSFLEVVISHVVDYVLHPWLKFWCWLHGRSTIGDRAFAVTCPRAWNNLPVDLRLSRTFTIFKTHLKSHLFNLSFPSVWLYYWLFLYRALEAACAAYASLNLSLLHYITLSPTDVNYELWLQYQCSLELVCSLWCLYTLRSANRLLRLCSQRLPYLVGQRYDRVWILVRPSL